MRLRRRDLIVPLFGRRAEETTIRSSLLICLAAARRIEDPPIDSAAVEVEGVAVEGFDALAHLLLDELEVRHFLRADEGDGVAG